MWISVQDLITNISVPQFSMEHQKYNIHDIGHEVYYRTEAIFNH